MKRSWFLLAVLAVLVLVLVPLLTGCGGGTTTTTVGTGAPTATTAAGTTESTAPGATTGTSAGASTDTTVGAPTGTEAADADAAVQAVTKSANIEMPPTVQSGVLQAGSDTAFPPFEFSDEKGGYIGFDVDVCTALAKKMGLTLEVVPTAWDGIIPALVSSRFDIIMSAMTITDERKQQINFSDAYIQANIAITAPKDKPITSVDGLKDKVVGVQVDTTGQFEVEKVQGVKEIKKYDTILNAFQDLKTGRVEAIVNDAPVNAYIIKDDPRYANTGEIVTNDVYGFGIKKENSQLLTAINVALKEIKDEGVYDKIFKKWYGELPAKQQ